MHRVLVSGSIAYDRIMDFDGLFREHMLPEKLHGLSLSFVVQNVHEDFGGTAGNVAYALALMGEKPTVLGTAGGDFGRYRDWFGEKGIETEAITVVPEERTAAAYIMTDRENNQIAAFHPGANARAYEREVKTEGVACAIIAASHPGDMIAFAKRYRETELPYFFDAGQQITVLSGDDLRSCIEGAAGIFGNDYELALIAEKTSWSETEMLAKTPLIVKTLGAKGTLVLTPEVEREIPAVAAREVVDPTGAGDSYRSGFIAAHLAGCAPEICAKVASTVAVHAVETRGTQNYAFSREELAVRYEEAYGEKFPL